MGAEFMPADITHVLIYIIRQIRNKYFIFYIKMEISDETIEIIFQQDLKFQFLIWRYLPPRHLNYLANKYQRYLDDTWWRQRAFVWYKISYLEYEKISKPELNYREQYLWVIYRKYFIEEGLEYYYNPCRVLEQACNTRSPTEHADMLQIEAIRYAIDLAADESKIININVNKKLISLLDRSIIQYLVNRADLYSFFDFAYFLYDFYPELVIPRRYESKFFKKGLDVRMYFDNIHIFGYRNYEEYLIAYYLKTGQITKDMIQYLQEGNKDSMLIYTIAKNRDFDKILPYVRRDVLAIFLAMGQNEEDIKLFNKYINNVFSIDLEWLLEHDLSPLIYYHLISTYFDRIMQVSNHDYLIFKLVWDSYPQCIEYVFDHRPDLVKKYLSCAKTSDNISRYCFDLAKIRPRFILNEETLSLSVYEIENFLFYGIEVPFNYVNFRGTLTQKCYPLTIKFFESNSDKEIAYGEIRRLFDNE